MDSLSGVQCIQTIHAGGEVDSMLLSGKMLIVGLHVSNEEGMVRAWHIDLGTDLVLPGRHRVSCHSQTAHASMQILLFLQHLHTHALSATSVYTCNVKLVS